MVTLARLSRFLDDHLETARFSDASLNGLQVEGGAEVERVVLGVSASRALFERAAEAGAQAVVTHHGLLWGKPVPLVGPLARRLSVLLARGISLLAYHLPLDAHPVDGNNARIAEALGLEDHAPWGDYHGHLIGRLGSPPAGTSLAELVQAVSSACGCEPLVLGVEPSSVRRVAVCSGGAGSLLDQAVADGADVFVTGEPGEPAQELAREAGIAVIGAGHYNTERFGVQALGERLESALGLETLFVDIPNPI